MTTTLAHILTRFITDNLSNIQLDVAILAREMNMSRPTLYRKIKSVSSLTPNELINKIRLDRAAALISSSDYTICEITQMVGFNSRSNFGRAFLKQFNLTPTEFRKRRA